MPFLPVLLITHHASLVGECNYNVCRILHLFPLKTCPMDAGPYKNETNEECAKSSETAYFWNKIAIEASRTFVFLFLVTPLSQYSASIDEIGGINWKMLLFLIAAWTIVYLCMMKGIKTSGKVCQQTYSPRGRRSGVSPEARGRPCLIECVTLARAVRECHSKCRISAARKRVCFWCFRGT